MHGFAILIGKCLISPPSPKLAPGISYEEYKQAYIDAGGQRVEFVEQCFLDWK